MDTVNNIDNNLSERLKSHRRLKNFSQESLAESTGLSVRTIQRIEAGESIGSAYTIGRIAEALGIDASELTREQALNNVDIADIHKKLNLLNLSTLAVILVPFSNIIFPFLILWKNKGNEELRAGGTKVLNFQILWTFVTLLLILLVPLFLLLFKPFRGTGIPLALPVYFLCVVVNVCLTLAFSVAINNHRPFLNRVPKIL